MMRKQRWMWYVLAGAIGVVSAEVLSGSTPVIFPDGWLPYLVYTLHYILIVDYLVRRKAMTLQTLLIGGLVLGLGTESLMTKVIWNPPWDTGEVWRIAGVGVYEVGFICGVWHTWLSTALPLSLTAWAFGQSDVLNSRWARRVLLALPLTMGFPVIAAVSDPGTLLGGVLINGGGILLLAWLYLRVAGHTPVTALALSKWERRAVWTLTGLAYLFFLPERAEAFPAAGPLLLGLGLLAGSVGFFVLIARAQRDRMPAPGPVRFTTWRYLAYWLYFAAVLVGMMMVVMTVGVEPVSLVLWIALMVLIIPGNVYLLRLLWRTVRGGWGDGADTVTVTADRFEHVQWM